MYNLNQETPQSLKTVALDVLFKHVFNLNVFRILLSTLLYLRLTPVYMDVQFRCCAQCVMLYTNLLHYFIYGPYAFEGISDIDSCSTEWWKNLLYVNTLFVHWKPILSVLEAHTWCTWSPCSVFLKQYSVYLKPVLGVLEHRTRCTWTHTRCSWNHTRYAWSPYRV